MYRKIILLISVLLFAALTCVFIIQIQSNSKLQPSTDKASESTSIINKNDLITVPQTAPTSSDTDAAYSTTNDVTPTKVSPAETETIEIKIQEDFPMADRVTYQPGFYYESLSDDIKSRITGISYPKEGCAIPYEDLRYVSVLHYDLDGKEQIGELICNQAIAEDMVEIFYELYQIEYPIEQIRLIDEYSGDDTLSMMDNNSSSFNYRVIEGTTRLSKHALGMAIDINPFYNPYVTYPNGIERISPVGSEPYADRDAVFSFKITHDDPAYKLFIEHGFEWGGDWKSSKDYQHFQKEVE